MASERRNNGQTEFQSYVGAIADLSGVSGAYGGWTNTDIMTGQNLGYTEAQAGMAFGGGIGQITLLANGPRLFNTGKNMMAPKTPAGIIDYGNGIIDVFSPSGPTTQITAGASYNPSMVTTNLAIANTPSQLAINRANGLKFQEIVLKALGLQENKVPVTEVLPSGTKVTTIFDAKNAITAVEIKSSQTISTSNQFRAQIQYADDTGLQYQLIVGPNSRVSGPLIRDINRINGTIQRFDPVTGKFSPYP